MIAPPSVLGNFERESKCRRKVSQALFAILQVTKVKLAQKQKEGIAEARSGRRQPVSGFSSQF